MAEPCCVCAMPADRFPEDAPDYDLCSPRCQKAHLLADALLSDRATDSDVGRLAYAILTNDPRLRLPEGA